MQCNTNGNFTHSKSSGDIAGRMAIDGDGFDDIALLAFERAQNAFQIGRVGRIVLAASFEHVEHVIDRHFRAAASAA